MGEAFSTHRERQVRRKFWRGNMKDKDRLVDLKVDGNIIVEWIFKKWYGENELVLYGSG
jgi:hypothetical protein